MPPLRQAQLLLVLLPLLLLSLTACPSIERVDGDARLLREGEELFQRGDYLNSSLRLERYIRSASASPQMSRARYWMGLCSLKLNRPKDACEYLKSAEKVSVETWLYAIGIASMRSGDMTGGRGYLEQLARQYPQGPEGKKAAEKLALTAAGYAVQLGYYSNGENAKRVAQTGAEKGLRTSIKRLDSGTGEAYYVISGPYASWSDALREADRIKAMGLDAVAIP
ncbi:MAG: hypothetical protein A2Z34_11100 [Planctomycetes bacterium RBG_16_59_8]|nr:MAG: hypothetical protein A2Z34_11100 [Planctomycetes bacterium RBG_16_59_8]